MVIVGKKVLDSILDRLSKLEKAFEDISAAIKDNKQDAETKIKEVDEKLKSLGQTVSNLTEDGGVLTPRQILQEYFYGKQEGEDK